MPSIYARRCPACHRPFESNPTFREDAAYCCNSCAWGQLCTCFVETDLADDGIDGLTLPFGAQRLGSMLEPRRMASVGEPLARGSMLTRHQRPEDSRARRRPLNRVEL